MSGPDCGRAGVCSIEFASWIVIDGRMVGPLSEMRVSSNCRIRPCQGCNTGSIPVTHSVRLQEAMVMKNGVLDSYRRAIGHYGRIYRERVAPTKAGVAHTDDTKFAVREVFEAFTPLRKEANTLSLRE